MGGARYYLMYMFRADRYCPLIMTIKQRFKKTGSHGDIWGRQFRQEGQQSETVLWRELGMVRAQRGMPTVVLMWHEGWRDCGAQITQGPI